MRKFCVIICFTIIFSFILCSCKDSVGKTSGTDSDDISETESVIPAAGGTVDTAAADFSVNLLKATAKSGENSLISPVSVLTALGMTANGAKGDTLKEMQNVLFAGKSIDEFNNFYNTLVNRITNQKNGVCTFANSAWFLKKSGFTINDDYLKLIKQNYSGEAVPVESFDKNTVEKINNWVKEKTKNNIDKILEDKESNADMQVYLVNALYFEAEWSMKYDRNTEKNWSFHAPDGSVTTTFMTSPEIYFIKDDGVEGFIKHYTNGFSFVGLLPDKGTSPEQYLSKINGEKLLDLIKNKKCESGTVSIPKFKTKFDASLNEPLQKLGIKAAFSGKADFTGMSKEGGLFISEVQHKTFIEFDECGTKAGAATGVGINKSAGPSHNITFDRPFIYMIIDNDSRLPLFIGIMNNPQK